MFWLIKFVKLPKVWTIQRTRSACSDPLDWPWSCLPVPCWLFPCWPALCWLVPCCNPPHSYHLARWVHNEVVSWVVPFLWGGGEARVSSLFLPFLSLACDGSLLISKTVRFQKIQQRIRTGQRIHRTRTGSWARGVASRSDPWPSSGTPEPQSAQTHLNKERERNMMI